ncbi:hypothetical protein GQ54DRAFT_314586 [Martensiomyces pterosporus]|nr:hypothetical protein GQ54DRAFT_314586 [Martensiomyces pterosporus]
MKLFVVASALAIAAHAQKITVTCNANDWAPRLVGMRIFEGRREEWRGDMRVSIR